MYKIQIEVEFQHSTFCVLEGKKPDNDWLVGFNLFFGQFNSLKDNFNSLNCNIRTANAFRCHSSISARLLSCDPHSDTFPSFWLAASLFM